MLWNDVSVRDAPTGLEAGVHNHSQLFLSCLCAVSISLTANVIASCALCQPRNGKSPWERQLRHYSGSIAFHKKRGGKGHQRAADVAWWPLAHHMQWRVVWRLLLAECNHHLQLFCPFMTFIVGWGPVNIHCILHLPCGSFFFAASRSKTQTLTAGSASAVKSGVQTTNRCRHEIGLLHCNPWSMELSSMMSRSSACCDEIPLW